MKWKAYKCKKCGNVFSMSGKMFLRTTCWECGCEDGAERYEKGDLKENVKYILYKLKKVPAAAFGRVWRWIKEWGYLPLILAGLVLLGCFWTYTVFSFSKHECDRLHDLTGYETDWNIYGGCYVKKGGEWINYDKYMNVNLTK